MPIDPASTLREAGATHLAAEGLPEDAGIDERWVRAKIGPIPFAYPNTEGRKRLVPAHDAHHLLAGYGTDLIGEGEMGAWELGTGLEDKTGVRLSLRVLGFVLPVAYGRLFHAYVRGRHCRSLYPRAIDDALLDRSVADVRAELGLDRETPEATAADRTAFRGVALRAAAVVWGPLIPIGLVVAWWLA